MREQFDARERGELDARLDEWFAAYREACPEPEPSAGFMPRLWARIEGRRVIVSHPELKRPVAVRYGWVDNPEQSNLVGGNGLPASPFRSDRWPWLTDGVSYSP